MNVFPPMYPSAPRNPRPSPGQTMDRIRTSREAYEFTNQIQRSDPSGAQR